MDHSKAVYITDMSRCTPSAALASSHRKYRWLTSDYEADGVSGVMLFAGPETQVPPVTLPLQASGWHAVFIGLYSNITDCWLKVRLTGDPAYSVIDREDPHDFLNMDERFWRHADLTGQDIVFAQEVASGGYPASVAYVKLVPLSEAEVAEVGVDRAPDADTKRLIFMNDTFGDYTPLTDHDPRQEIWDWLQPYRDTDFKTLFWCAADADLVTYPSKIATLNGGDATDFPREVDRQVAESLQVLTGKGVDTLSTAVEYAHSMGIDVHASLRMEAFQCSPPFEDVFAGHMYREHPEWRCVDIDGRQIARMSYAFPGVRDWILSMFKELAGYDVDGINPIFNRGAPFLLYEQPLVDGFKRETGMDPRDLDEEDDRYLSYRAGVMTEFMRSLRREMDAIGERRGRKVEISAHVLNDEETNRYYALDVPAWVQQGLVDNLISYPWRDRELDVGYFGRLTRDTAVKYYPDVMPRRMSPEEYRQVAIKYYAAGADGLCFWDTNGRDRYLREWSIIRRLGHKDRLASWDDGDGEYHRTLTMRSVGGYVLDKYPPHWAY